MPDQYITVTCSSCRKQVKAPVAMMGKKGRCKCGAVITVAAAAISPAASDNEIPLPVSTTPTEAAGAEQFAERAASSTTTPVRGPDKTSQIVIALGCAFLLALAFSPLLHWVSIFTGGMLGISGDGKIVLAVSLICVALVAAAFYAKKHLRYALAAAAAWGTVAAFWMAGLVYRVANIVGLDEVADNPFAAAFATQISPGAGLYIGLAASIAVAACFILAERRSVNGSSALKRHGTLGLSQAFAVVIGVALIVFYGAPLGGGTERGSRVPPASGMPDFFKGDADSSTSVPTHAPKPDPRIEAEMRAYLTNVELRNVKVEKTVLGSKGVFGEVKNLGNRTLKKVSIVVYCLDDQGKAVFEKVFHPLWVSDSGFSIRDDKPLKPNYSEKFGYELDDAPSDWKGKVRVQVTAVEFADDSLNRSSSPEGGHMATGSDRGRTADKSKPRASAEGDATKRAYLSRVALKNVKVGKSVLDETGVFGEVKNVGNRTLKEVQITIYCLDKKGQAVFEKTYRPVYVSDSGFSMREKKPLRPNYTEKFGCKLDDAPSDWSGQVRVIVTDIEFAD